MNRPLNRGQSAFARTTLHLGVCSALLCMSAGFVHAQAPAAAESPAAVQFNIAPGPLAEVLGRFAAAANVTLSFNAAQLADTRSEGLQGRHSIDAGFARLLAGSGFEAVQTGAARYTLRRGVATTTQLPAVQVVSEADGIPKAYAGGQVAKGARLGLLGNQSIMDTPFNVTSYTAELIENQGARTVADVVMNDPSVRFTTSTGHAYENFRIRGYDVNQNDISVNGLFGMMPIGHTPLEFVERVEVLKGPNSMFSGMSPSGAVGGVINLVPKRAGDDPLTRVTVGYQSGSQLLSSVDVGRRFGENKEIGVRVNASLSGGETITDGLDKTRQFLAAAVDYRGRDLRASLDVYRSKESYKGGTPAMFWFTGAVAAAPDPKINQLPGASAWLETNTVIAQAEYDINRHFTAFGSVGVMENDYLGFINGSHVRNINGAGTSSTTTTSNQMGYSSNVTTEAGVRARFETGPVLHEAVLQYSNLDQETGSANTTGAAYTTNIYNPVYAAMPAAPTRAPKTSLTQLTSLALVDTLSFADDKVRLTLGLRHQTIKSFSYVAATGAVGSPTYDESKLTPAVAIVVKPWGPSISVYANYVEALAKGDSISQPQYPINYNFAPYVTKQVETGVKWNAGTFTNTLALFQIEKPVLIGPGAHVIPSEGGEKRVRGLEWNTFGEIVRNVRLLGGIAYTEGVQTKTLNGLTDGKDAVGAPKWQGNIGAEWDIPGASGLTVTGRVVTTSSQYINAANTQSIPGWSTLDVGARYATKIADRKTVFRLNVANLFDRHYYSGSFSDTTPIATLGLGRTVTATASVDF